MEKTIQLLKDSREKLLKFQGKNFPLCMFYNEAAKTVHAQGWQEMIAYFPSEMMCASEKSMIVEKNAPSYSIGGIIFIEGNMLYYIVKRTKLTKMITEQKNYDHLYSNTPIRVFESEYDFVKCLLSYQELDAQDDYLAEVIAKNISLLEQGDCTARTCIDMKYSISEGILKIDVMASLANEMIG